MGKLLDSSGKPMDGDAPGLPEASSLIERTNLKGDLPRLITRGSFEGPVEFSFYKDAVESTAKCMHCGGIVKHLLRLPREEWIVDKATRDAARQNAANCIQRRHQCPILHDGKTTVDDFLETLH